VDDHGNVVGIISARLGATIRGTRTSDELPENVNYAIKISLARSLFDSVPGGPLKFKPEYSTAERKFEDVVQEAQDAVVVVLVQ